jgi:IS1 family transposase
MSRDAAGCGGIWRNSWRSTLRWLCVLIVLGVAAYGQPLKMPHHGYLIPERRFMFPVNVPVFDAPVQRHHIARFTMPGAANTREPIRLGSGVRRNVLTGMVKNVDITKIRLLRKDMHNLENIALFYNLCERFSLISANEIHINTSSVSAASFTFEKVSAQLPFDIHHYPRAFGIYESLSVAPRSFRRLLLKWEAVPHRFSGFGALIGLLPNGREGQECNYHQRPVSPFNGCLSFWRFFWGSVCLCCMARIVYKRDGIWWTCIAFGFGGITIVLWFTGRTDGQNNGCDDNKTLHVVKIVPQKHLTSNNIWGTVIHMANVLNTDKQIAVIGALAEGSSIRSIERITGVHRDTIMRLGVKVGKGCAALLDAKMRDLPCQYLEFDEIWGFIGKKEKHVTVDDSPELGDVWTFCAVDAETKIVPTFRCGKRDRATANAFVQDVASRMKNRVQISTDGLRAYVEAVEKSFGSEVDFAQIVKTYTHDVEIQPNRRYSAPEIVSTEKKIFTGSPDISRISTSYVERLNGTTRTHMRRLTRLTLAFSKKLENFEAAVGLHFAYYNFVKRHNTLRCTPAMAAGIEQSFLTVGDLVEASA